jgi:4-hydroxy-tetrahydrodipicolinate reductase
MSTQEHPVPPSIRIVIHGATGRMGQALARLAAIDAQLEVVAAVSGSVDQRVVDGIPQFSAGELEGLPAFDVAIDFSRPEGFSRILELCVLRSAALVSGTTGLNGQHRDAMQAAAGAVPLLWASNFSLGVAVLADLVARAARTLPGWDCDIVEIHHRNKLDAPSGTALSLGQAAARSGAVPRYASLRAGDVVGEHTVQFTGIGERIELVHRAGDREIFARGALHAAAKLVGRAPGLYRISDILD